MTDLNTAAKKDQIRQLATTGGNRPKNSEYLGKLLLNYLNPKSYIYDEELTLFLKVERPDWFQKKSSVNKAKLLAFAQSGGLRADLSPVLKRAFSHYVYPKSTSYDIVFHKLIEVHAPAWLIKEREGGYKGRKK